MLYIPHVGGIICGMRTLLRSIRRHPPSSLAAVAMAAIGVALLTLALAVLDAVQWRPLPFPGARRLVVITTNHRTAREERRAVGWSYPRLTFVRERATTVEHVAPWRPASVTLEVRDAAERISGEFVSADYFHLVGVSPRSGRVFSSNEDLPGAASPLVVVAAAFVERQAAAGAPIAIGTTLRVNGQPVTVIGIMPAGFRGLTDAADFWLPTAMAPVLTYPEYLTTDQDFITMLARPRAGTTPAQVAAEVGRLAEAADRAFPREEDVAAVTGVVTPFPIARVRPDGARAASLILAGAVVLFLLTAANLVALALGRALARRRESAVVLALGATPARLWRQQATEHAVLILSGAVLGLGLLALALQLTGPIDPLGGLGRSFFATWSDVALSWRLAGWWLLGTIAILALAAGIPATWTARRVSLDDLREGSHGSLAVGTSLRRPGAAALLLATEAMLAVVLVGAAAQLLESYRRMQRTPVGVEPSGVLTFEVQPSEATVSAANAPAFIGRVLDAIRSVPGVVSASVDGGAPLSGSASSLLHIVGRPDDPATGPPPVLRHYVGEDHFATLGIPLLAGRAFTAADREGAPRVVIVSESAARRYFPGGDAVGQRVWFAGSTMTSPDSSGEIVGVVGDVKYTPLLAERTTASFYSPYRQFTYGWRTYFVKVQGEPRALVRAIADAVQREAPGLPLLNVRPLDELMAASFAVPQRAAAGTGWLAALGLLLASSGIWAVVSHAVVQRRREVAIRLAHGATGRRVVRLLLRDGLAWPLAGLLAGIALGAAGSRVLRALLYGIEPGDPGTLLAGAATFAAAAIIACLLPALRSARTRPIEALRAD